MSLENNLKRIADALEKIAASMVVPETSVAAPTLAAAPVAPAPAPAPTAPAVAEPVAPAPAPAPVAPAPAPAAPTAGVLTPEEMNTALVAEFKRLGNNRGPIDAAMTQFGVTSVNDLPTDKQQDLLATIRAIQS